MAKGIVTPRAVCETTDTAYLKSVEDVVYYSSLTRGLAGGALISAPANSPVQSLDLKTIVDSPTSPSAQNARDIHNLIDRGLANEIPESVLRTLINQAALVLVTKGAGEASRSPSVFESIPIVRNLFAFSSDVLSANNLGDVLKYVFCPDSSQTTEPAKAEVVVEDIKDGAKNTAEKVLEGAQKVLKVPQDAAKKATENVKEGAEAVQGKAAAAADDASKKMKEIKDDASAKAAEAAANVKDKVAEGTEKANEAGEKLAQDVKDKATAAKKAVEETAESAQKKAEEINEEGKKKAEDVKQKVADEAKNAADNAAAKAEEIRQEL
ncbi:hypothetical protein BGX30_005021 [Mortierella sp. GBA39]|nr:hypothetical protein BGX30_005021 [Mortierella sp. GBA39]